MVSPKPDKVAVTVYRDPDGSGEMELGWLNGFALITETRRVSLPAGEVDLRFEGVAGGLIPQSAVVSGLGDGVSEKNRDSKLLSPGTLIDAYLGQRVHLRRTSKATGKVIEQEAIVRASGNSVVVQTATGVEALRCTGLNETLLTPNVPADLSAKPTLSVRARSAAPVEATVTLTYLTSNFDWRAHYVATLAPDGKTMSLFAWLTLANGDETGFANADTMAVAGRLNREEAERLEPEAKPIQLNCWPDQRTHEMSTTTVDSEQFDLADSVTVEKLLAPPPPAPEAIMVTGSRIMAQREDLGDLKLYRIPIPVTVASNSQKQVALLEKPQVAFQTIYTWQLNPGDPNEQGTARRVLHFDNRTTAGLGLPLPYGTFTLYALRDGQPFLLGEGRMLDRAVDEKIEVPIVDSPGVRVLQRHLARSDQDVTIELVVTNDQLFAVPFKAEIPGAGAPVGQHSLKRRDGKWVWMIDLPANGSRTLRVRYRDSS